MDKTPTGQTPEDKGQEPKLEDILREYAPDVGPGDKVPSTPKVPSGDKAPSGDKVPSVPKVPSGPKPQPKEGKILEFPQEDTSITARFERLMEKADRYAEGMFQGDIQPDPQAQRREELLPGVDYEEEPTHAPEPRRKRRAKPLPDLPPAQLAQRYKRGLAFLRTRAFLSLLWCIPQFYLMLAKTLPIPALSADYTLRYRAAAVCLMVSALLAYDVLGHGLTCLIRLRMEAETVLLLTVCANLADALTMPILGHRDYAMPYCAVVSAALFFALWGRFLKRRALRQSCRVAAGAAEPYLVTLDERMWDGRDAFTKWSGETAGYGSQVQAPDGAQRAYHIASPIILLCAGVFSLLASVGRERPELFFWCLSATLTAGCGFTSFLAFAMPFSSVTTRLGRVGAALGGWDAVSWGAKNCGAVLTDSDLFPPGSVTLNGMKLYGDLPLETAVSYAATLVKETGSGMEKPFQDLLKTQGTIYRKATKVMFHEGGVTGVIGGRQVYVGSAAFMEIMGVALPQGLKVKSAVFCAADGHLEAIFALNYKLHSAIAPAIDSLIANHLRPILATRDFLIIPDMLRQRFKLPVDRMEFPSLDRRRDLSSRRMEHDKALAAVLCREGLGPYAEAVVGGKRLAGSTRAGVFFSLLGSAVGLSLAFYLCLAQAFASLSAGTMLAFVSLWLIPAAVTSGWANRY